jgi:hypothetical protein
MDPVLLIRCASMRERTPDMMLINGPSAPDKMRIHAWKNSRYDAHPVSSLRGKKRKNYTGSNNCSWYTHTHTLYHHPCTLFVTSTRLHVVYVARSDSVAICCMWHAPGVCVSVCVCVYVCVSVCVCMLCPFFQLIEERAANCLTWHIINVGSGCHCLRSLVSEYGFFVSMGYWVAGS